jgi:hypothetical protein
MAGSPYERKNRSIYESAQMQEMDGKYPDFIKKLKRDEMDEAAKLCVPELRFDDGRGAGEELPHLRGEFFRLQDNR